MDFLSEEHLEELRQAHEKSPPPPPSAATIALTVLVMMIMLGMIAFVISDYPLPRNLQPAIKGKPEPKAESPSVPGSTSSSGSANSSDSTVPANP